MNERPLSVSMKTKERTWDPVSGPGGFDAKADRETVLPVPGGPSRTTFSALVRNTPVARCAMVSRLRGGW